MSKFSKNLSPKGNFKLSVNKKINYQKLKVINKDFKFNDGKEHCRVFCKGFKKDISRDEITKIFETIGTIVDIRLPETREVSFLR